MQLEDLNRPVYLIAGANHAGPNHPRVEAAQTPARGTCVPGFALLVEDGRLNSRAVNVQGSAWSSALRKLYNGLSDPVALPRGKRTPVQSGGRDVLSERAGGRAEIRRRPVPLCPPA